MPDGAANHHSAQVILSHIHMLSFLTRPLDATAVKTFQASVVATHINGANAEDAMNQPGRTDDAVMDVQSAVSP